MKKIIALTLALLMLTMSFVACNKTEPETTTEPTAQDTKAPETTEEVTEAPVQLAYNSAIEMLQIIFEKYNAAQATDDTKLWVGGGNIKVT